MRGQLLVAGLVVLLLGADTPNGDPAKEEAAKLEGTWIVMSQSQERELPDSYKVRKMVVKGSRLTLVSKEDVNLESEFTVDPAQKPKHLDCTVVAGLRKGAVMPGIYELDGDDLKYCYDTGIRGPERTVRPKEFQGDLSKASTVLLVLKREKP